MALNFNNFAVINTPATKSTVSLGKRIQMNLPKHTELTFVPMSP